MRSILTTKNLCTRAKSNFTTSQYGRATRQSTPQSVWTQPQLWSSQLLIKIKLSSSKFSGNDHGSQNHSGISICRTSKQLNSKTLTRFPFEQFNKTGWSQVWQTLSTLHYQACTLMQWDNHVCGGTCKTNRRKDQWLVGTQASKKRMPKLEMTKKPLNNLRTGLKANFTMNTPRNLSKMILNPQHCPYNLIWCSQLLRCQ